MANRPQRASWICRDAFERARFLDLHTRLVTTNTRVLTLLAIVIAIAFPTLKDQGAVLPVLAGIALFGAIQRLAPRFARPEVWVYWALLGAITMIGLAVALGGMAQTGAVALLAWPVAGLAGRFPNRAVVVGTAYTMALLSAISVGAGASNLVDQPLTLALPLVALVAVSALASVHRDSDIDNRGAATIDALTGMLNRNALASRQAEIESQSHASRQPVGVIIADLDRFKAINDLHGHAVGDTVLRDVAYVLRSALRAYDLAYRLGGEEFAILLPGADLATAAAVADHLHAAVRGEPIAGLTITASLGVAASAAGEPFSWEAVFARADAALYLAKQAGRDRVVVDGDATSRSLGDLGSAQALTGSR